MKIFQTAFFTLFCIALSHADSSLEKLELQQFYRTSCNEPSEIYHHLPTLKSLSTECCSAVEIGIKHIVATWAILDGLSESQFPERNYIGIGSELPHWNTLQKARELAESQCIHYQFWKTNDIASVGSTDLLFIGSVYTYGHLTSQLEKFSSDIHKYIVVHETSSSWGYDQRIDCIKKGLWPAIIDFLKRHPEWSLYKQHMYNHGLTVLKRVEDVDPVLNNKIILCTGPSLKRKVELKAITENDLKWIPFKKIFLSTNDPNNADVTFNHHLPIVEVFASQGHQLDCLNCIISSIKNVVNDTSCLDDDIILFKHESVFLNDIHLFKQAVRKIFEGYDAVTRFSDVDLTDVFLIKVAAARKVFSNQQLFTTFEGYCAEKYFTNIIGSLPNIYRIPLNRINRHWEDNELGFFHIYSSNTKDREFWDKNNYDDLYR